MTIQLSKPVTFGHPSGFDCGFADVDATWWWGPPVSPSLPLLSFFSPLPLLSPCISRRPAPARLSSSPGRRCGPAAELERCWQGRPLPRAEPRPWPELEAAPSPPPALAAAARRGRPLAFPRVPRGPRGAVHASLPLLAPRATLLLYAAVDPGRAGGGGGATFSPTAGRPQFVVSGEVPFNFLRRELPRPLLARFQSSPGRFPYRRSSSAELHRHRRRTSSTRLLAAAPHAELGR